MCQSKAQGGRRCPSCARKADKSVYDKRKANRGYRRDLAAAVRERGYDDLAKQVMKAQFSAMPELTRAIGMDPSEVSKHPLPGTVKHHSVSDEDNALATAIMAEAKPPIYWITNRKELTKATDDELAALWDSVADDDDKNAEALRRALTNEAERRGYEVGGEDTPPPPDESNDGDDETLLGGETAIDLSETVGKDIRAVLDDKDIEKIPDALAKASELSNPHRSKAVATTIAEGIDRADELRDQASELREACLRLSEDGTIDCGNGHVLTKKQAHGTAMRLMDASDEVRTAAERLDDRVKYRGDAVNTGEVAESLYKITGQDVRPTYQGITDAVQDRDPSLLHYRPEPMSSPEDIEKSLRHRADALEQRADLGYKLDKIAKQSGNDTVREQATALYENTQVSPGKDTGMASRWQRMKHEAGQLRDKADRLNYAQNIPADEYTWNMTAEHTPEAVDAMISRPSWSESDAFNRERFSFSNPDHWGGENGLFSEDGKVDYDDWADETFGINGVTGRGEYDSTLDKRIAKFRDSTKYEKDSEKYGGGRAVYRQVLAASESEIEDYTRRRWFGLEGSLATLQERANHHYDTDTARRHAQSLDASAREKFRELAEQAKSDPSRLYELDALARTEWAEMVDLDSVEPDREAAPEGMDPLFSRRKK